jgi:nitrate reductase NapE component
MADPPSYPGTRDETAADPGSKPAASRPRRTLITFWIIVIALFLVILALHLTGTLGPGTNG